MFLETCKHGKKDTLSYYLHLDDLMKVVSNVTKYKVYLTYTWIK